MILKKKCPVLQPLATPAGNHFLVFCLEGKREDLLEGGNLSVFSPLRYFHHNLLFILLIGRRGDSRFLPLPLSDVGSDRRDICSKFILVPPPPLLPQPRDFITETSLLPAPFLLDISLPSSPLPLFPSFPLSLFLLVSHPLLFLFPSLFTPLPYIALKCSYFQGYLSLSYPFSPLFPLFFPFSFSSFSLSFLFISQPLFFPSSLSKHFSHFSLTTEKIFFTKFS